MNDFDYDALADLAAKWENHPDPEQRTKWYALVDGTQRVLIDRPEMFDGMRMLLQPSSLFLEQRADVESVPQDLLDLLVRAQKLGESEKEFIAFADSLHAQSGAPVEVCRAAMLIAIALMDEGFPIRD